MEFKNIKHLDDDMLESLFRLQEAIFKDSSTLMKRMENKPKLLFTVAMDEAKLVGYKIGYELSGDKFYSWLGGVDCSY